MKITTKKAQDMYIVDQLHINVCYSFTSLQNANSAPVLQFPVFINSAYEKMSRMPCLTKQEPMLSNCSLEGLHPFSASKTIAIILRNFINIKPDASLDKLVTNTFSSFLALSKFMKRS